MPTHAYHINSIGGQVTNQYQVMNLLEEWEFSTTPQVEDGKIVIEERWTSSFIASLPDGPIKTDEFLDELSNYLASELVIQEEQIKPEENHYQRSIEPAHDFIKETPENWNFYKSKTQTKHQPRHENKMAQYQNDCGLWLKVVGNKVLKYVGNSMFPVSGSKETIGTYDTHTEARQAAIEWMKENPNPWEDNQ